MLHLENFDSVLHDRQAIDVGVVNYVCDISMDENLAGTELDNLLGRHTRVRAA